MHTDTTRDAFLRMLRKYGTIEAACDKARVGRSTAYRWRDADADFKERWEAALDGFKGWTQQEMVEAASGEGRWAGKGPALQPLVALHRATHPENAIQRHEHQHADAIYFFDVPATPIL